MGAARLLAGQHLAVRHVVLSARRLASLLVLAFTAERIFFFADTVTAQHARPVEPSTVLH